VPSTLALRHVSFEDLGTLGSIFSRRSYDVRYLDVPVTSLADVDPLAPDLLVVLGGPIGVNDTDLYPFLAPEIELIAQRLRSGRPTLGICLGSQLIARALGARVYTAAVKEIGWAPLDLTPEGRTSCLRHLAGTPVLHWHGDTFDLPQGAVRLASTPGCENQAFSWGKAALALQFHAETAGTALESWFVAHTAEIRATPGITVPQLRADTARCSAAVIAAGTACFVDWLNAQNL
jgi:GMP synthase (glutamine-hydrolysing)